MTQQAIEDTKDGALPEEQESSEEGVRSRPWEESELRQLFREEANAAFNGFRSDAQKVQAMLPQLEEVMGSTKRLEAFLKNFVKGTLTEEQYADLEQADQLAVEQGKRAKAEATAKALEEARSKDDGGKAMAWHHVREDVADVAEEEGVTAEIALSLQPKSLGALTARDPFGYIAHKQEWVKAIRSYSDKQKKEEEPKSDPVTARGGAGKQLDAAAYREKLTKGEALEPTEIVELDRRTAALLGQ